MAVSIPNSPSTPQTVDLSSALNDSFTNNTFEIAVRRNTFGLGLSITGGLEAPAPFTNLIRIKKVFPLQPAWENGILRTGDILLEADGVSLVSVSLRQALDILRCGPSLTKLLICRPPESISGHLFQQEGNNYVDVIRKRVHGRSSSEQEPSEPKSVSTDDYVKTTERREDATLLDVSVQSFSEGVSQVSLDEEPFRRCHPNWTYDGHDEDADSHPSFDYALLSKDDVEEEKLMRDSGEFFVNLQKVNGSLGFSLRQIDEDDGDVMLTRHAVKALLKEPALSDGRIKPGDRLIEANGYECALFSHIELISFLRRCPEKVELKFQRLSSSDRYDRSSYKSRTAMSHPNLPSLLSNCSGGGQPKRLRQEAKEMVRSLRASRTSLASGESCVDELSGGRNTSSASVGSARRRRLGRPYSPQIRTEKLSEGETRISAFTSKSSPLAHELLAKSFDIDTRDTTCSFSPTSLPELMLGTEQSLEALRVDDTTDPEIDDQNDVCCPQTQAQQRCATLTVEAVPIDVLHTRQPHDKMLKVSGFVFHT